jgi:hypothetical protein
VTNISAQREWGLTIRCNAYPVLRLKLVFSNSHGGGKRCKMDGCHKSAVGGSLYCTGHGGGKRCSVPGCDKSAQSSTNFCVKHGGGKKCQYDGCMKVARGKTLFCAAVSYTSNTAESLSTVCCSPVCLFYVSAWWWHSMQADRMQPCCYWKGTTVQITWWWCRFFPRSGS